MINDQEIDYSKVVKSKETLKHEMREVIKEKVGDTETLLGTTSDGTQLALYMLAELLEAINTATTLDDLKTAIHPRLPLAQQYLAGVADGTVVPTFIVKGVDAVVADVKERSTEVSNVLKDAAS